MINKTVLIVDDEPRSRKGLKRTLESWSNSLLYIKTAKSAHEAITILADEHIDLLITDIRMPEMTGLNLIETIATMDRKPVFIIISAYSEFDYAHQALELGVMTYLLKPVKKEKLITAVENAFKVIDQKDRHVQAEKVLDRDIYSIDTDKNPSDPVKEAITYINDHLHEKISLKDVAKIVHLNPSYFSVLFKEKTEMTFSEYLIRKRLQHAKHLLISTQLPISNIAEKCGYQTAKYFIKIFKENEGLTPSKYRKEGSNSP
ncbi:response regulator transcription factor [Evansella halocellulosilytica]|uniref:response regulator transcription factor n=1 Tax=Evansella halocellulosilytica TaxID=2011013 RepID=UPI000BB6977C|nr:response regulator [Evansella halocellulosilytica]